MFPHVNFFRFFFWGTRLYIDTSHTKINSVAICSRLAVSSAKCPRLIYAVELETYSRRENLVFEGIEEKEKENTWGNIVTVMKNYMKLDNIQDIKIQRCHRIGKPNQAAKKPRPIIVRFLLWSPRRPGGASSSMRPRTSGA